MKKTRFSKLWLTTLAPTIFLLVASSISPAQAEAKWTPISSNDYIFGFTSFKYSCWKGITSAKPPILEVYSQNTWVQVATSQILPAGSDLQAPCGADFPIAAGYQWIVMSPAPPAYATNRYQALYRERIQDTSFEYEVAVTKQVTEIQEKCCVDKITSKRVPYIAKVKKNGKTQSVIKYKTQKVITQVTYTEEVLVDKIEYEKKVDVIPGYISDAANISIYPSLSSMNEYVADAGRSILCSFGFTEKCKN
jgi:hypothetical protein